MQQPVLETQDLRLRAYKLSDAKQLQQKIGIKQVSMYMTHIPYPYLDGMAEEYIKSLDQGLASGSKLNYAIVDKHTDGLLGAVGFTIFTNDKRAELGYWVAQDAWGRGYATQAVKALVDYGFTELGLNKIHADYYAKNPASGRVMQKVGMQQEGCLRQHYYKDGQFHDMFVYSILKQDYLHNTSHS